MSRHFACVCALGLMVVMMSMQAKAEVTIFVDAGEHDRMDTPLTVEIGTIGAEGASLVEVTGNQRVETPVQVDRVRANFILSGKTPKGTRREFVLTSGAGKSAGGVEVKEDAKELVVACGGVNVLRYYHAVMQPPEGQDKKYARSGFIHPLWSPGGKVLTEIHPKDHIHHMGLWNAWTKTKFEGRDVDFWNLKDGKGLVRFVKFAGKTSGPVFGGFSAVQEHVDLTSGAEKVVLNEVVDVKVWNVGKEKWVIDLVSTQKCVAKSALELEAYRYGGLGFRGTSDWGMNNSDYLTSEGKTRTDGHGTRARWCNVFGETKAGPAGVQFMSHPQNREHPEPMRIWPDGYIFFNFCPIQKTDWVMEPGKEYVLKYRMFVYDGTVTKERCEQLWRDFGEPPAVKVEG